MCSLTFKAAHSVISQDGLEKQKEPNSKTGSKSSDREKVTHCVINSFVEKEMSQDWKVKYRMFPFKFGKAFAYYLSVPVDLSQACVERSFQMSNTFSEREWQHLYDDICTSKSCVVCQCYLLNMGFCCS